MARNYNKVGTIVMRGTWKANVAVDGSPTTFICKVFPRLIRPRKYWLKVKVIGDAAPTAGPEATQDYSIVGLARNIPEGQTPSETDDITPNELMGRYFDLTQSDAEEDITDISPAEMDSDVGIGGKAHLVRSELAQHKFFERRKTLGLPDSAVFADANTILYVDAFSTSGVVPRRGDITEPILVGFTAWGDEPTFGSDTGQTIFGSSDSGTDELYEDIIAYFRDPDADSLGGDTEPNSWSSALAGMWAFQGLDQTGGTSEAEVLNIQAKWTCLVDCYEDVRMRRWIKSAG